MDMSGIILINNNISNMNILDKALFSLKNFDFIQDNNIDSLSLQLTTTNNIQEVTGTITYNNGLATTLTKNIDIDYESAINKNSDFINSLMKVYSYYPNQMNNTITINYDGISYKCNKQINVNGVSFYILEPITVTSN